MAGKSCQTLDPRILRTRRLLQQSLETLLKTKGFDEISVQDITGRATLNRATFYDHYPDKFALLECMVGSRFHELLAERKVRFDCATAVNAIVLAVCHYLAQLQGPRRRRQLEPHMESAIIAVVRNMLLEGLKRYRSENAIGPGLIAAAASWAIYGAAKEWAQTPRRCAPEEIAAKVVTLVDPILKQHSAM